MGSVLPIRASFPSRERLRVSCSFDKSRALIRAPWTTRPLLMGSPVHLQLRIDGEAGPLTTLESARTGPASGGVQWFLVYGAEALELRKLLSEAPAPAPQSLCANPRTEPEPWRPTLRSEPAAVPDGTARACDEARRSGSAVRRRERDWLTDSQRKGRAASTLDLVEGAQRPAPRWRCSIPVALQSGTQGAEAVLADVSETGVKLEGMSAVFRPGDALRVEVQGNPGQGPTFTARVIWANEEKRSAGLRFLSRHDEARLVGAWVAEIQVAALSASMTNGYMAG